MFAIEQLIRSQNDLVELQSELIKLDLTTAISPDYMCFTVYDVTPRAKLVIPGVRRIYQTEWRLDVDRLSIILIARLHIYTV